MQQARQAELAQAEAQADQPQTQGVFSTITSQLAMAGSAGTPPIDNFTRTYVPAAPGSPPNAARLAHLDKLEAHFRDQLQANPDNQNAANQLAHVEALKQRYASTGLLNGSNTYSGATSINGGTLSMDESTVTANAAGATTVGGSMPAPTAPVAESSLMAMDQAKDAQAKVDALKSPMELEKSLQSADTAEASAAPSSTASSDIASATPPGAPSMAPAQVTALPVAPSTTAPAIDTRKLIRNAQLDLEVKSFQAAMDQITALTKAAGGYVDTSNSQKGGNGKLQGTVVVKVLPQNLDDFLLKLRDLGEVQNQSVSTDDVTKDYYDTQARLDNSRRMEEQLQDLLKHANSKVSDLLAVERELGRVRGQIEQMQGQLKLYDFEVQYATVTMQLREKDLNQTAAYLLKEQDDFSLFATDVEGTFQKARQAADDFKAQILIANLVHNSGSDVAAELTVMVAPDQIEPFLAQVRLLGRVANFTRQTQRVAKDGGDSDEPADQTLTEKDKVQVHLSIRSDDETRKQVALTVVTKAVDDALDQAKTAALANAGVEILSSSLNKTPDGQSTAQLSVRVPGKDYSALIAVFKALGRTASLSIQRNDDSGPGANGDDAPVIVSLSLTDDDTPLQETELSVLATDVDNQAQQIKKDAAASGVEVKASSFERQPDGTELAQMTFRLPMSKYPAFVESVKALGKVESLSVHRDDRPDQTVADDTAPAEISLQLHNQGEIVPDDSGLWATLRKTFGDGAGALFTSVRVIGVVIAFLTPWVFTLVLLAWVGRRIYIWRKK
jgi:autotransporter-associated beta strand protein